MSKLGSIEELFEGSTKVAQAQLEPQVHPLEAHVSHPVVIVHCAPPFRCINSSHDNGMDTPSPGRGLARTPDGGAAARVPVEFSL